MLSNMTAAAEIIHLKQKFEKMEKPHKPSLPEFVSLFSSPAVVDQLKSVVPSSLAVNSKFWQTTITGKHLSSRMKQLILVALHATVTALDSEAIKRNIRRAKADGASNEDILDVLTSAIGVANHALYVAVPILVEELQALGCDEINIPAMTPEVEAIKNDFIQTRGFWNDQRDLIARLMPEYFCALSDVSTEPWKNGALSPKERELIYIAVDCSPTHSYGPGLKIHIRHALQHGATKNEILEVFQLAASTGLEGFILGSEELFGNYLTRESAQV